MTIYISDQLLRWQTINESFGSPSQCCSIIVNIQAVGIVVVVVVAFTPASMHRLLRVAHGPYGDRVKSYFSPASTSTLQRWFRVEGLSYHCHFVSCGSWLTSDADRCTASSFRPDLLPHFSI